MGDEFKSAVELALERVQADKDLRVETLDDEQREAIKEVRSKYRARKAETEFAFQDRLRAAAASGEPEAVRKIADEQRAEKRRLEERMEQEVEAIRQRKTLQ